DFLTARLYSNAAISEEREHSVLALDALFTLFLENPSRMPPNYVAQAKREPLHRVVCDYIAGMTDHFLLRQHQELIGVPVTGKN
ncbi:MAG: deoxyguanosinetriphosphate triphosphohydrolase, partial [Bryobacteraceae bacterium]